MPTATAAIVGGVGMFFTWLSGKQARDQAAQLAREERQHTRTMASEARSQDRRAEAYVAMLQITQRVGHWAQSVRPVIDYGEPLPAMPDFDSQYANEARISAFGSIEVHNLWRAWLDTVHALLQADRELGIHDAAKKLGEDSGINPWPVHMRIQQTLRPAELDARTALAQAVNRELNGEADSRPGEGVDTTSEH